MLKTNDTVEFVRACIQTYRKLRNFSNDLKKHQRIKHVDFDQSSFGPDREEWPGSPVGYSWDIQVIFKDSHEEIYTLDVTFESDWAISAERSKQGDYGPEPVEEIFEYTRLETSECTRVLSKSVGDFLEYCKKRSGNVSNSLSLS